METLLIKLTKEEISFLCDAITEVHGTYCEDGIISLFGAEHQEEMVKNLGQKLEEAEGILIEKS